MSVKIVIKPGGVFENPGANQSDLVFWYNTDTEPHYPVPGCTGLRVAPGDNTKADPYLASPNYVSVAQTSPPTSGYLPHTFNYTCAIHGETGEITFNADSGQVVTLVPPAAGAVAKEIVISRGGNFSTAEITQSQTVYWTNNDDVIHFPVPNCTGLLAQPDAVTNAVQIVPIPALPMAIAYGCAMEGHESESGTINVYNDIAVVSALTLSSATPFAPVAAATGGKSPYKVTQDGSLPYITAVETSPAGSSAGISLVLNAAPPSGTKSPVDYQLNATDALGNPITGNITVTLT